MKKYYIYKQDYKILEILETDSVFLFNKKYKIKYTDFIYIGYLVGAKEVYDFLKYNICLENYSYPIVYTRILQNRYLIIDEENRIRNFEELTKNIKKNKNRGRSWHPYQKRNNFKIKNELKQKLVKEDIEICLKYGINIKPMRDKRKVLYNSWDWYGYERPSKKGRSWKEQSKRKRQWKNIKNF